MWLPTFAQRLDSWSQLRVQAAQVDSESALHLINAWWFRTPWRAYHLHWDDQPTWPDPWQLLSDNMYCGLARGLGIMYTITLIDRSDLQTAQLTEHGADNLVVISQKKYILNWDKDQIVNINLTPIKTRHSVGQQQLKQIIK
jgi:hypothetical protein